MVYSGIIQGHDLMNSTDRKDIYSWAGVKCKGLHTLMKKYGRAVELEDLKWGEMVVRIYCEGEHF